MTDVNLRKDKRTYATFYPYEKTILDLWDAGKGSNAIMAETGFPKSKVVNVIKALACSNDHDKWQEPIRRGSIQLLDALRIHHPEQIA